MLLRRAADGLSELLCRKGADLGAAARSAPLEALGVAPAPALARAVALVVSAPRAGERASCEHRDSDVEVFDTAR